MVTMVEYSIRAGRHTDVAICADIWMRSVAHRDLAPPSAAVRVRALRKLSRRALFLVLCDSLDRVVGYSLSYVPFLRAAHISQLAIRPDLQGRGLGRRLAVRTIAELRHRRSVIGLNVLVENVSARRLYESLGFVAGRTTVFPDSGRSAIQYSLRVASGESIDT